MAPPLCTCGDEAEYRFEGRDLCPDCFAELACGCLPALETMSNAPHRPEWCRFFEVSRPPSDRGRTWK